MPIQVQSPECALTQAEVAQLWQAVLEATEHEDAVVTVRSVTEAESAALNERYRNKPVATNVLTFSYASEESEPADESSEHDVAICVSVIEREATAQALTVRDYTARVVVHALLHVVGFDHELSKEARAEQEAMEEQILQESPFLPGHLEA